jgi:hypothetical protein
MITDNHNKQYVLKLSSLVYVTVNPKYINLNRI